ncbi:MAG: murein biosynthesis integral membrane protein MurJ [Wolinella sp.]
MLRRAFFTNSSGILLSRIFGFFRDVLMAATLGAGIWSDIFFVAFKMPNLFRRLFGEGAFNQAFLPSFIAARYKGAFTISIALIFLGILTLLCIFVTIFNEPFTRLIAYGFSSEQIKLAAPLVAINFWYLWLVFVVTFLGAILQYKRRFLASAYSSVLLNTTMIGALYITQEMDSQKIVFWLSWAVLIGGILQILLHIPPFFKADFHKMLRAGIKHFRSKAKERKESSARFFRQFIPATLGASTAQIAAFIDTLLATFLASGAISYLYYANRIFQLPLAIFAIATSTALFPTIARAIKNGENSLARDYLARSFWFLLYTLSFATIGGILLSREIIWLLFERGEFTRTDTLEVAYVLSMYMIGLLPFGIAKIFSLWLYSNSQQALAARISIKSLLCGVGFSLVFMQFLGASGLALAGSLSGFLLLFWTLRAFGAREFWDIIRDKRSALWLVIGIVLEILIIIFVKSYFQWSVA